jgi:hypothetical protein
LHLGKYRSPAIAEPDANSSVGARTVFSIPQRVGLLTLFALIVVLRLPNTWVHGRFQDEEATVFLAYAWHYPWTEALFRPFAGYWNLGANATTVLVSQLVKNGVVPLERAPYLTMGMALASQLMPAVLILTGRAEWLANRFAVIAALLMIAIAPATEEIFFNVLHIQFHLALCVALILALDVPRRRIEKFGYGLLLLLAPLCGPAAIVTLPLFALRAAIDRDFGRIKQFAFLAAGSAVQLILFYGPNPMRGHFHEPGTIAAAMFVRMISLPALGIDLSYKIAGRIYESQSAGTAQWEWFATAAVIIFAGLIVIAVQRRDAAIWLLLSCLSIGAASLFGMVIVKPIDLFSVFSGERYNFLPDVLLGLTLLVLATRPGLPGRSVYAALCMLMLFTGGLYYFEPLHSFANGPSWPTEVRAWRSNHRHPLAVWPTPWAADLSDESRPCSPPGRDLARSTDPRYCESGWIAGFFRPDTHGEVRPGSNHDLRIAR